MRKLFWIIPVLLIAVVLYASFNFPDEKQSGKVIKDRDSQRERMVHELYEHGGILVYPASDSSYSGPYLSTIKNFKDTFGWIKIKIIPDTAVTARELQGNSVFLTGTFRSNIILRKIADKLPVRFSEKDFSFAGKSYKDTSSLLTMFYPSPWNKNKVLYLITGNSNKYIADNMNLLITGDISVSRNGLCEVTDTFKKNSSGKWIPDKNTYRNYRRLRKVYPYFRYFKYVVYSDSITPGNINKINAKFTSAINKMEKFFGGGLKVKKSTCYIFDNFENKGMITRNTHLENMNWKDGTTGMVVNGWIKGDDFYSPALLLLRRKLGRPASDFLEKGLAIHFTNGWRKKGYKFWAAFIAGSGDMPELKELLNNNKLNFISPLIADPLAGSFVDYLIKYYGKKIFLDKYGRLTINNANIPKLRDGWEAYLKKLITRHKKEINLFKNDFNNDIPEFQKGFCFAHVGYDIYNGYISKDAERSLQKIRELGANSFSITPFTSMKDASKPESLRFWEFAGAENDESLIYLTHIASKLKMTVMMKPQIYLGREKWPGDINMQNKDDWRLFFHYYYNWISHYAMISEMYGIPILCIGNEIEGATVGHEKEWVKMISKIRNLYDGKITYGANWNYEFNNVKFWGECDYIGISEYFPLSEKDNPTDRELLNGAEADIKKINSVRKKYNKPLIFTEVGFRSTLRPWKTAGEKTDRNIISLKSQARCYRALFEASYGKAWLAGMYWWKWPSYLSYGGGAENNLYVPNNKPAQSVVKEWYMKKWD